MLLTALELAADTHKEYGLVLLGDESFSLVTGLVGIHILELLSRDEENVSTYLACNLGIPETYLALCVGNCLYYGLHSVLEELDVSLLACNDLFPVPLIHENGVGVVCIVIAADSVHIGVDALTGLVAVTVESHSFPLCK